MTLFEVFRPIEREIAAVEADLKSVPEALGFETVRNIVTEFFQKPGKLLRPRSFCSRPRPWALVRRGRRG